MLQVGEKVNYTVLCWNSDWNGYEVGFPEVCVVGLYSDLDGNDYYINTENGVVLEVIEDFEEGME